MEERCGDGDKENKKARKVIIYITADLLRV
jgi:hypothetical protein